MAAKGKLRRLDIPHLPSLYGFAVAFGGADSPSSAHNYSIEEGHPYNDRG